MASAKPIRAYTRQAAIGPNKPHRSANDCKASIPNDHMPPESNSGNPPRSCRPENSVEPPIKGWKIVQNFPAHQKPGSVDRNLDRRLRLGHSNSGKKRVDQNNPEQNCKYPQARRNCREWRKEINCTPNTAVPATAVKNVTPRDLPSLTISFTAVR